MDCTGFPVHPLENQILQKSFARPRELGLGKGLSNQPFYIEVRQQIGKE